MSDPVLMAELLAFLLAIGFLAGVLAGLLGVGGGILLVPAFFYTFETLGFGGADLMQIAVATSLATIVVTAVRSLFSHHARGAVDWTILRGWAPGIAAGALLGVAVVSRMETATLQFIFGALALFVGTYLLAGRERWRLGPEMPRGGTRIAGAGAVGLLSVLMGVGGGSFGVPIMTLHGVPIHRAVGTASGFGLLIAVPSVIGFLVVSVPEALRPPFTVGSVNLAAFAITVSMTVLSAPLGARLAHALPPAPLRRFFGVFLLVVALGMMADAWRA